jgi:hypothetical protein
MGGPLSGLTAEIFIDHLETFVMKSSQFAHHIKFWARYIGDVVCIWSGPEAALHQFLKHLNSVDQSIEYTLEIGGKTINFLDLTLTLYKHLNELRLKFDIYRKPNYTGISIHNDSLHPVQHKLAIVTSAIHWLVHLPLQPDAVKKETNLIKRISKINGLTLDIDKMIRKKRLRSLPNETSDPSSASASLKRSPYVRLPFLGPSSYKLSSELRRFGYKAAFYPVCTLANLSSLKDFIPPLKKSGIYRAECADCSATYYGQTGRAFRTRIMEHLNEYNKARRIPQGPGSSDQKARIESAIAEHSSRTQIAPASSCRQLPTQAFLQQAPRSFLEPGRFYTASPGHTRPLYASAQGLR